MFPLTDPVAVFAVLIAVIFISPFLFRLVRIPDVAAFILAGVIMGLIQQFAAGYLDGHWGLYGTADVLPYIILLIILLFKPHGLFGIHEIERV